ncbi:MAG: hypothetical protein VB122_06750 [Erysipelotrichales bacterium]|nr:hypothetical protein [Erysipelotrichales bacterium]
MKTLKWSVEAARESIKYWQEYLEIAENMDFNKDENIDILCYKAYLISKNLQEATKLVRSLGIKIYDSQVSDTIKYDDIDDITLMKFARDKLSFNRSAGKRAFGNK